MASLREVNQSWLTANTIFFIVVGNFGNINVIWSTIRKKELQSKSGKCSSNNEIVDGSINYAISGVLLAIISLTRDVCYPMIAPFMFCFSYQASLVLSSALDLLFILLSPVRYRAMRTLPYVIAHCIPGGIFSLFFTVYGWMMMNDDVLDFCNPAVGPHPVLVSWWAITNMAINICILIVYFISFVVLKSEAAYSEHRGVVRRLSVIVVVFVFSWFFAVAGVGISISFQLPGEVLPVVTTKWYNYYVCFWRSSDYRQAFKEQLSWMLCKRSSTKRCPSTPVRASQTNTHLRSQVM
ncbi:hypothetical protein Aduo_017333 [Ancylostoma duodenale]